MLFAMHQPPGILAVPLGILPLHRCGKVNLFCTVQSILIVKHASFRLQNWSCLDSPCLLSMFHPGPSWTAVMQSLLLGTCIQATLHGLT